MLKTSYLPSAQTRQLAADFPGDERALKAAAALDDTGITITNCEAEFSALCAREDVFLAGTELGQGFFAVIHRRTTVLPETPPDPVPKFKPPHWWKRSRAFWRHAVKSGWSMCDRRPLEKFLKRNFGTRYPWYLSDSQFAEAWRLVSWGPPPLATWVL